MKLFGIEPFQGWIGVQLHLPLLPYDEQRAGPGRPALKDEHVQGLRQTGGEIAPHLALGGPAGQRRAAEYRRASSSR